MTSTHYPRHNPLETFGPAIDEQTSLREAFEAAELLGWNVRTKQVFVRDDEPRTEPDALIQVDSRDIRVPNTRAILYDSPYKNGTYLVPKLVTDQYAPIQNESMLELAEKLSEFTACTVVTARWDEVRDRLLVALRLNATYLVGDVDPVEFYVIGSTSHDSSLAFRLSLRPFRLACGNMMTTSLPNVDFSYYAKHTLNAPIRISEFEKYLEGIDQIIGGFVNKANEMFFSEMSEAEISSVARKLVDSHFFPKTSGEESGRTPAKQKLANEYVDSQLSRITEILNSPTVTAIQNSAWGGLQAFLEWMQYEMEPPAGDNAKGARILASRAVWPDDKYVTLATAAFTAFSEFVPEVINAKEASGLSTRIEDMDLTVRTFNCLKREGINTLAELVDLTESQLINIRNFGLKSVDEVFDKLSERGLALKAEPNLLENLNMDNNVAELTLEQVRENWPQILEGLRENPSSWVVVNASQPVALEGDVLSLEFSDTVFLERFKEKPSRGTAVFEELRSSTLYTTGVRLRFVPRIARSAGAALPAI